MSDDILQELLDDSTTSSPSPFEQNQPRQRLRSWLSEQLDQETCPGCLWLNKEMRVFKLSWKHYGRPGFDEERDAKIFREWAKHTKRYSPGDPTDVSTWKTRFRNALHKMPDIQEMADHHMLDGNDPFRMYRFRTPDEMKRIREAPGTPSYPPLLSPAPSSISCYSPAPSSVESYVHDPYPDKISRIEEYLKNERDGGKNVFIQSWNDDDMEVIEKLLASHATPNNVNNYNQPPVPQEYIPTYDSFCNIPIFAVGIKLSLSDKDVLSEVIQNMHGLRIAYQPPPLVPDDIVQEDGAKGILSDIYGPLDAQQIYYPHADDVNTQKILNCIRRGLVIEVYPNGDIFATRLCQARVFYSGNIIGAPKGLARSQPTLVYSFQNEFLPALTAYRNGLRGGTPSCEVFFSFGQQWSLQDPLKEVFVHCSVTHFLSRKLFKNARAQKPYEQLKSAPDYHDMLKDRMENIVLSDGTA